MAEWTENKYNIDKSHYNVIDVIVTHDLQDCIDDSLDRVYDQLSVINYTKYTEEDEKGEEEKDGKETNEGSEQLR